LELFGRGFARQQPARLPERVKRVVGKVLTGNGITSCEKGSYVLVGGEEVFAHRSRHRTPISGSIKVRVLTRARGRCECCGAHEHQRALEVDHIVPSNHGGTGDLSNLQALCFRCNAGKRDTDSTDFRDLQASYALREADCGICVLKLITGRMARPENELRSDPDLQSLEDCSWKESTVIGCDPMRRQTQPRYFLDRK